MLSKTFILFLTVAAVSAATSNIVRPCQLIHHKCMRDDLVIRSKCNPVVRGFIPSEYTVNSFRFDAPYFNATYVDHNLKIRNHNKCFVSEFFFNTRSHTLVIGLDCPLLEFESTRAVIQHYSLREDSRYNYNAKGKYPLVRLTMNLALDRPVDLCNTYIFTDVTALPSFLITPNDKETANILSTDLSFINIFEREMMQERGKELAKFFINSYICDFGCNF